MRRNNILKINHMPVLRAIWKRGHLFSQEQLAKKFFYEEESPQEALRKNIIVGLRFIESNFDFIDENGNIAGIDAPDFHKDFLLEVKKKFSSFNELEKIVKEFLDKNEA